MRLNPKGDRGSARPRRRRNELPAADRRDPRAAASAATASSSTSRPSQPRCRRPRPGSRNNFNSKPRRDDGPFDATVPGRDAGRDANIRRGREDAGRHGRIRRRQIVGLSPGGPGAQGGLLIRHRRGPAVPPGVPRARGGQASQGLGRADPHPAEHRALEEGRARPGDVQRPLRRVARRRRRSSAPASRPAARSGSGIGSTDVVAGKEWTRVYIHGQAAAGLRRGRIRADAASGLSGPNARNRRHRHAEPRAERGRRQAALHADPLRRPGARRPMAHGGRGTDREVPQGRPDGPRGR